LRDRSVAVEIRLEPSERKSDERTEEDLRGDKIRCGPHSAREVSGGKYRHNCASSVRIDAI
jgi:hypothetical protein